MVAPSVRPWLGLHAPPPAHAIHAHTPSPRAHLPRPQLGQQDVWLHHGGRALKLALLADGKARIGLVRHLTSSR